MDDTVEFSRFHLRHSKVSKRNMAVGSVVYGLCFLLIADLGHLFSTPVGPIAVGLVGALVYSPIQTWSVVRNARTRYSEGKNIGLSGWHRLSLREDASYEESEGGSDLRLFKAIERIEQNKSHVYIYTSALTAFVVPKAKVARGDLATFVGELRARIGQPG